VPGKYVFTLVTEPAAALRLHPVATVTEDEGLTLVSP
jgi:hypothetical protein